MEPKEENIPPVWIKAGEEKAAPAKRPEEPPARPRPSGPVPLRTPEKRPSPSDARIVRAVVITGVAVAVIFIAAGWLMYRQMDKKVESVIKKPQAVVVVETKKPDLVDSGIMNSLEAALADMKKMSEARTLGEYNRGLVAAGMAIERLGEESGGRSAELDGVLAVLGRAYEACKDRELMWKEADITLEPQMLEKYPALELKAQRYSLKFRKKSREFLRIRREDYGEILSSYADNYIREASERMGRGLALQSVQPGGK